MNPITRFRYEIAAYNRLASKVLEPDFGGIDSAERQHIVEALVVKICSEWEVFAESLLIDCLRKDTSEYASAKGMTLPQSLSRNICELLLTGLGFFDSKSMGDLKGTAKRILVPQYNPFKEIKPPQSEKIDEFFAIRNYIAHRSRASKLSLDRIYRNVYWMQQFVEPGKFLLAPDDGQDPQSTTRLQVYFDAFFNAADIVDDYLP